MELKLFFVKVLQPAYNHNAYFLVSGLDQATAVDTIMEELGSAYQFEKAWFVCTTPDEVNMEV
jgi:hypothetical protein